MGTFLSVIGIIVGVVVIGVVGTALYVFFKVKSELVPIIKHAKNIDFDEQEKEYQVTPKSVNAMTSVYLPRIQQDFPDFNYYEFKAKAENMIKSAFSAVSNDDINKLINASSDLKAQIGNVIDYNRSEGLNESYKDVNIHRTEIKNYVKRSGTCVITLQSSVEYIHAVKNLSGNIVKGDDEHLFQTRYDTDLMYIQDVTKVEDGESSVANNCPNCGAPLQMLGVKHCPYCGSGVEVLNIKTWSINKLTEC